MDHYQVENVEAKPGYVRAIIVTARWVMSVVALHPEWRIDCSYMTGKTASRIRFTLAGGFG